MRVGHRVDQLHIDAHLIVRFLHAAFEDMHDSELFRDLRQVVGRALEALRRGARDDFQVGYLGETCQDFLLHAFGEISVVGVATEIIERQHRDRFCRQFRLSSTGGISARVASEEKQSDGDRGSNDHDKNPNMLLWLSRRHSGIDIFRALDSFRRELEGPCDHEGDRESEHDREHDEPHGPVRNLKEWKDLRGDLNEEPGDNRIGNRHFVNVASLQLGEEFGRFHRQCR